MGNAQQWWNAIGGAYAAHNPNSQVAQNWMQSSGWNAHHPQQGQPLTPQQPPLMTNMGQSQPFGGNAFSPHQTDPYGYGNVAIADLLKKLGLGYSR